MSPMLSRLGAGAMAPAAETTPQVGFQPVTPQAWAGMRSDPPVSEPSAATTAPLTTAAAEPDEETPETKSEFHGLRTRPRQALRERRARPPGRGRRRPVAFTAMPELAYEPSASMSRQMRCVGR
jgi:hypothetical protein